MLKHVLFLALFPQTTSSVCPTSRVVNLVTLDSTLSTLASTPMTRGFSWTLAF